MSVFFFWRFFLHACFRPYIYYIHILFYMFTHYSENKINQLNQLPIPNCNYLLIFPYFFCLDLGFFSLVKWAFRQFISLFLDSFRVPIYSLTKDFFLSFIIWCSMEFCNILFFMVFTLLFPLPELEIAFFTGIISLLYNVWP